MIDLLSEFAAGTGSYSIAIIIIAISIILSGIGIGIGLALKSRKIINFGKEELIQSFINAALVGGLVLIVAMIDSITLSFIPIEEAQSMCPSLEANTLTATTYIQCQFSSLLSNVYLLISELMKTDHIIMFLSNMEFEFGVITSAPFSSLANISSTLQMFTEWIISSSILINLNIIFLGFVFATAMLLFLPLGIILRSFFLTRKIGGALMAIGIGFYVVYPLLFIIAFPYTLDSGRIDEAVTCLNTFNSKYQNIAVFSDLNKDEEMLNKINEISMMDSSTNYLLEDAYEISNLLSSAVSDILFIALIIPLIALGVTIVAIYELARVLGGEIITSTFEML